MNILVYGAGVLGSLYAARLQEAGQHVSLLARDQRLQDIREHGIVLMDVLTGQATTTHLNVVEQLGPEDRYDLAVVVMGKHQVAAILPRLAANKQISSVLFLHNNAAGPQAMVEALGRERVLLGFAGAGGKREGHVIDALLIKQQPTTLGDLDGRMTPRLEQIAKVFKDAGFTVAISANIDVALKTHAVFITCMESAVVVAGGNKELASRQDLLLLMVTAIRQGFKGLQARGLPIIPFNLKLMFLMMPKWFPVLYWKRTLQGKLGEYSLDAHAKAAPDEIRQLIAEVRTLVSDTAVSTPAMDQLYQDMDTILTSSRLNQ
jgi:2-dehydropantoate 2-reductase